MKRSARLGITLSTALVSLAVVTSIFPAVANPVLGPLETVSVALDSSNAAGWWTPLDEFDGTVYMAYNYDYLPDNGLHEVKVVRRDGQSNFTIDCLRETIGGACTTFGDDVGHNQPSIAVDGDGYIHAFVSMHHDGWRYYRSTQPGDPTTMVNRSSELPNQTREFTYPSLDRAPNGDVWLVIRSRAQGAHQESGHLYHYHVTTGNWTWTTFAFEQGMVVYPDDVKVTPDGIVHIAFEWAHTTTGVRHEGSYLQYRPATQTFHNISGAQVNHPVTRSTPGLIYQPLLAGETYCDCDEGGLQNAKLAMYQQGSNWYPAIGYRYRMHGSNYYQVRRARYVAGSWNREVIYNSPTRPAIGVSHDGTTARVYYTRDLPHDTAYVAESTGGGIWSHSSIAAGEEVQRLAVIMRSDGTDLAYLAAPNLAPRGKLHFRTIDRS